MTEPVSLITHGCVTKDPTSWHFKGAHTSCLWVPVGEALGCSSAGSSGSRPLTISPALPHSPETLPGWPLHPLLLHSIHQSKSLLRGRGNIGVTLTPRRQEPLESP